MGVNLAPEWKDSFDQATEQRTLDDVAWTSWFGWERPVLSSSSRSHDTGLRPYARLFEHLVGVGDPLWAFPVKT